MQNGAAALSVQACEVQRHADNVAAQRRRRECSLAPRREPSASAEVIARRPPPWRCTFSQAPSAGGSGRNPSRQLILLALRLHLATASLTRLTSTRRKRWTRQHASVGTQVNSATEIIGGAWVVQLWKLRVLRPRDSTSLKRWTRQHAGIGTQVNSPTQTIGGALVVQLGNSECLDLRLNTPETLDTPTRRYRYPSQLAHRDNWSSVGCSARKQRVPRTRDSTRQKRWTRQHAGIGGVLVVQFGQWMPQV